MVPSHLLNIARNVSSSQVDPSVENAPIESHSAITRHVSPPYPFWNRICPQTVPPIESPCQRSAHNGAKKFPGILNWFPPPFAVSDLPPCRTDPSYGNVHAE